MPAGRELSDTVAEPADIPGLCDEDLAGENRILADCPEEAAVLREAVLASCHGYGKIEAEAVNLYHLRPVAEGVHDEPERCRVVCVEAVAAACEVGVGGVVY